MGRFKELFNESNAYVLPKVFKSLGDVKGDEVHIHFSDLDMMSTNPRPHHSDPLGIYAFPRDYVEDGKLIRNNMFSRMPYYFVIIPSPDAKILDLSTLSSDDVEGLLKTMGLHDKRVTPTTDPTSTTKYPGAILWHTIKRHISDGNLRNSEWNRLFKLVGYNVVKDNGLSIIHHAEASQTVFLTSKSYKIIDQGVQTSSAIFKILVSEFPEWKKSLFRSKGPFNRAVSLRLSMVDTEKSVSILFSYDEHQNMRVMTNGFEKDIDKHIYGEIDIHGIISDVKTFLSETKPSKRRNVIVESPLLRAISDNYNLSFNKSGTDPLDITRYYRDYDKDHTIKFILSHSPKHNNKFYMSLEKSRRIMWGHASYHYYAEIEIDPNEPPENILIDTFRALVEKIEVDESTDKLAKRSAINTLEFIKKRVFRIS